MYGSSPAHDLHLGPTLNGSKAFTSLLVLPQWIVRNGFLEMKRKERKRETKDRECEQNEFYGRGFADSPYYEFLKNTSFSRISKFMQKAKKMNVRK